MYSYTFKYYFFCNIYRHFPEFQEDVVPPLLTKLNPIRKAPVATISRSISVRFLGNIHYFFFIFLSVDLEQSPSDFNSQFFIRIGLIIISVPFAFAFLQKAYRTVPVIRIVFIRIVVTLLYALHYLEDQILQHVYQIWLHVPLNISCRHFYVFGETSISTHAYFTSLQICPLHFDSIGNVRNMVFS